MSATTTSTRQPGNHCDEPTYWFAIMEIARERGDFERAAQAKSELARLGIRVSYRRPGKEAASA